LETQTSVLLTGDWSLLAESMADIGACEGGKDGGLLIEGKLVIVG
jgi:hypothetical protein